MGNVSEGRTGHLESDGAETGVSSDRTPPMLTLDTSSKCPPTPCGAMWSCRETSPLCTAGKMKQFLLINRHFTSDSDILISFYAKCFLI